MSKKTIAGSTVAPNLRTDVKGAIRPDKRADLLSLCRPLPVKSLLIMAAT